MSKRKSPSKLKRSKSLLVSEKLEFLNDFCVENNLNLKTEMNQLIDQFENKYGQYMSLKTLNDDLTIKEQQIFNVRLNLTPILLIHKYSA